MFNRVRNRKVNFNKIYRTPQGVFPSLATAGMFFGVSKCAIKKRTDSELEHFEDWVVINQPSDELCRQAKSNVEAMLANKDNPEDSCSTCNTVDDMLFSEQCWLLRVQHEHSDEVLVSGLSNLVIHYTFRRKDFRVTYTDWINGVRPHVHSNNDQTQEP
jgi:hypothetical protein